MSERQISSDCAIGGISKPFPKLKRIIITIKLQPNAPIRIRTLMVPSNYTNVMIESIRIDGYEILLGEIPAQVLALGISSHFADIANGMMAKDSVTAVLRRLRSSNQRHSPLVFVRRSSKPHSRRAKWLWKWRLFPTASRRKPLQFGMTATRST